MFHLDREEHALFCNSLIGSHLTGPVAQWDSFKYEAQCSAGVHGRLHEIKAEFNLTGDTGGHRYMSHGSSEWQSRFALFLGGQGSDTVEKE